MKKCFYKFFYFSVQIETENYKLVYESQFKHFTKWGKTCISFDTFFTNFEVQSQKATKCFSYFWLQLVRIKSTKKSRPRFLITFFIFWDIGQYYIFISSEIGTKNRKSFITQERHIFWGITGTVLLSTYFRKCAPLLKKLRQRLFELDLEHCRLTENSLRRLTPFCWYCNFNPATRLNDVWYLWNAWYFSENKFFQFFLCLKILTLFKIYR